MQEAFRAFGKTAGEAAEAITKMSLEMNVTLTEAMKNITAAFASTAKEASAALKPLVETGKLRPSFEFPPEHPRCRSSVEIITEGPPTEPEPVQVTIDCDFNDVSIMIVDIASNPVLNSATAEIFYDELINVFAFSDEQLEIFDHRVQFWMRVPVPFAKLDLDFIRDYIEARVREMLGFELSDYEDEILAILPLERAYRTDEAAEAAATSKPIKEVPTVMGIDFGTAYDRTAVTVISVDELKDYNEFRALERAKRIMEEAAEIDVEDLPTLDDIPLEEIPESPPGLFDPVTGHVGGARTFVHDPIYKPSLESMLDEGTRRAREDAEKASASAELPRPAARAGGHLNPHRTPGRDKREAPLASGAEFMGSKIVFWTQPDFRGAYGRTERVDKIEIRNGETGYHAKILCKENQWTITIIHGPIAARGEGTKTGRFKRRGVYPVIREAIKLTSLSAR